MFPCHCEPIIYFRFFEVCTYPSIYNFGLEASPFTLCNSILEARLPLSNTSSEAGAMPSKVCIENGSDRKFQKAKFFHSFFKTTFLHVSCYPFIVCRKYIYGFLSLHLPLDTKFWTRGSPLVMRPRKAGVPLTTRARQREFCP